VDKQREIDALLKDLYVSSKQHQSYLTQKLVYSYLINRNVLLEDRGKIVSNVTFDDKFNYEKKPIEEGDFFSRWIKRFEKVKNIKVFCSPTWQSFCQFKNGDVQIEEDSNVNYVKMYIPLKYDHLYEGANRIFDFLARENIPHMSKISRKIRFDNVVVRLPNFKDAERLQAFLDQDSYIHEGLMKGNAFTFQKNGISYAMDGRLSHNNFLSGMISDYINKMVKDPNVSYENVGFQGFYQFVNDVAENYERIENYLDSDEKRSFNKIGNMADGYGIVRLLQRSMMTNDMRFFEEHFNYLNNQNARKDLINAFDQKNRPQIRNNTDLKEGLVQEFILTTMKKYPLGSDPNYPDVSGYQYIYAYLKGNDKAVTRDNDLRNRMKLFISRDEFYQIIKNSGVPGRNIDELVDNYIKKTMLDDIICSMMEKMPDCAILNIQQFMKENRLNLITNSVRQARMLAKSFSGREMYEFLNKMGVQSLEEYITQYYVDENMEYNRRGFK